MSETFDDILYTRINETNTACVGTIDGTQYAIPSSKKGEIKIRSYVLISGVECKVTTIGRKAFYGCVNVTNIIIPKTVTTLLFYSFKNIYLTKPLVLSSSITSVETNFIDDWFSNSLLFCGTKEPSKEILGSGTYWISTRFTGAVIVPPNYEKNEFCSKNVIKLKNDLCMKLEMRNTCNRKRNIYYTSLFIIHIQIGS